MGHYFWVKYVCLLEAYLMDTAFKQTSSENANHLCLQIPKTPLVSKNGFKSLYFLCVQYKNFVQGHF